MTMSLQRLTVGVLFTLSHVWAHSWVEQLSIVAPNASYVGEHGYARSFVDKGMPGFDQNANLWTVPPLENQPPFLRPGDLLCHPSQRTLTPLPDFPRLKASPGGILALRYAENGHSTIPGGGKGLPGKPERGGTVFVFGTSAAREDETLSNTLQWTAYGRGGDGRGTFLTAQNFDDGRCYQLGNGAALANLRRERFPNPIPDSVAVGRPFTLYWVWQWPTAPGQDPSFPRGKDEYYVSCMDVGIVQEVASVAPSRTLAQQDPMSTAVSDFRSCTALTTDPLALSSSSNFGVCTTGCSAAAPASSLPPPARLRMAHF
ncbi:hypothetical protein DM02DRAFT_678000 [Periconia macrospinosa]|uniref:DUF7492 domain-containing protein n=1 Tax=Periconia macrospinosa TaxID=97972 RepID=A0A2V1D0R7_9PLEO|nr:hypothetical protein DM02DRAFT_678000 [Periconia macrospinosa]